MCFPHYGYLGDFIFFFLVLPPPQFNYNVLVLFHLPSCVWFYFTYPAWGSLPIYHLDLFPTSFYHFASFLLTWIDT